jgi:endonuclease YncB( thermonuclease family)
VGVAGGGPHPVAEPMHPSNTSRRFLAAMAALAVLAGTAGAERRAATVLRVVDGDTVIVAARGGELRVRLLGVDAPEVAHEGRPGQPYSRVATDFTKRRISEAARIEIEIAGDRVDDYGRTLAFLWLWPRSGAKPVNLSEELLRAGLARAIRHFEYPEKSEFLALEAEARRDRRGMWRSTRRPPPGIKKERVKGGPCFQKPSPGFAPLVLFAPKSATTFLVAAGRPLSEGSARALRNGRRSPIWWCMLPL